MRFIAHRGLFNGPDKQKENSPEQVELALAKGFDVEIDVWYSIDTGFVLGHDDPIYPVSLDWLYNPHFWIHAKNLHTLELLSGLNVFWHENDQHTVTTKGYIWSFPGVPTSPSKGIAVMPEHANIPHSEIIKTPCYGVCSDYVEEIRNLAECT